jgi:hypothetical protein
MKKIAILCSLLLLAVQVRADMVINEVLDAGGQSQNLVIKVKGDKIRTDVGSQMSTIADAQTGDFITLLHAQKTYMKMSAAQTKVLIDQMRALHGGAKPDATPAEAPKFVDAGKGEKVNDYETEKFTAETPDVKFTFWVAKDFPNAAGVLQVMRKIQTTMQSKLGDAAGKAPDLTQLPGLPVKTVIESNGQVITQTLVSVKEDAVADTDVAPPADYKEMAMPSMNGVPPSNP